MAVPGRSPPIQPRQHPPVSAPQAGSKIPVVPIICLVLYFAYVGVLIVAPMLVKSFAETLDSSFPPLYRLIGAGVLLVIFAIIIFITTSGPSGHSGGPTSSSAGRAPQISGAPGPISGSSVPSVKPPMFKPVQSSAATKNSQKPGAPIITGPQKGPSKASPSPGAKAAGKSTDKKEAQKETRILVYPREVEGGIFGDTYIDISEGKVLKLRTLVVEPKYLS